MYPNPAVSTMVIEGSNASGNDEISIRVMNALGQIVYESHDKFSSMNWKKEIDVSAFANGMYVLEISSNDHTEIKKVQVE